MGMKISGARVFDGKELVGLKDVFIESGKISESATVDQEIDGTGCTLLPGFIDSHVHLYETTSYLKMAIDCGVTTMLDMGIRNPSAVDSYRNLDGLPRMLSSCGIIFAPGSAFIKQMQFPFDMMCQGIDDVKRIVDDRIDAGADYIKLIFEGDSRGTDTTAKVDENWEFPPDVGQAIVDYSHERGYKVRAHCVSVNAYQLALMLGIDTIEHEPYTEPLPQEIIDELAASDAVVVPTMAMGEGLMGFIGSMIMSNVPPDAPTEAIPPLPTLELGISNLSRMIQAGVKIIAGTDSNLDDPTTPADVRYGEAFQNELCYYVQAGMDPLDALACATSIPASYWGLKDRGVIEPGKLADLLLVEGEPDKNIQDVRNVRAVIKNGLLVERSSSIDAH